MDFSRYGHFKAEKDPILGILRKTGLFQPWNGHNSKNPQDMHTKVYIFEISVKFCVDWYVAWLSLKKSKIWLILAGGQKVPAKKSTKMTSKNSEKKSVEYSAEWSTILRTPVLKKKKVPIWNTLVCLLSPCFAAAISNPFKTEDRNQIWQVHT